MDAVTIHVQKIIPAKKWKVLRLLTRIQDFPRFMPNVKECTVISREKNRTVTCWSVDMDGVPLSWKEEEVFDFKKGVIRFRALEGDLECFEGEWSIQGDARKTEISVTVKALIGLPMIEQMVGGILAEKISKNFTAMLEAMNEHLRFKRYQTIAHRKTSDVKGFAVIGHPYNLQHLIRILKFFKPDLKLPKENLLIKLFEWTPSYEARHITNFRSRTGKLAEGYFIMCPIIPDMFNMGLSVDVVLKKVLDACKLAEGLGVGIVTLGGFTSIAGERYGKSFTEMVNVPVTTGNTFTVAMVLEGIKKAAKEMEMDLSRARVTVIGGSGDIGSACARILSEQVAQITLTARRERNLIETQRLLSYYGKSKIDISTDSNEAIRGADIVIAAASTSNSIIDFNHFKPGAVVCDVGYPKNISYTQCRRNDILIFSGGITTVPSEFTLGFDNGMPNPRVVYGCFAEAIILELEERYENFSWGKGNITSQKVELITQMGKKHGFEVAPFFWGDRLVKDEEVREIGRMKV